LSRPRVGKNGRVRLHTRIQEKLLEKIYNLSFILSYKKMKHVNINEIIEEAFNLLLKKYDEDIKEWEVKSNEDSSNV
jgi:hypothetical protein